ncbi:MAG: tetratricopeptide repeat protein [Vicinamibacterales bacterium]
MTPIDLFAADAHATDVEVGDPGPARVALIIGSLAASRRSTAQSVARAWAQSRRDAVVVDAPAAAEWPFRHPLVPALPDRPVLIWAEDVHEAFVNRQTSSTRLVTTQPAYLFDTWNAALAGRADALLLASADSDTLRAHGPEVLARRGPFASALVYESPDGSKTADHVLRTASEALLVQAFRSADPAERLELCVRALEGGRTAPRLLAAASASMEVNDLDAAARDLDAALTQAPEWAAAHFEHGKLWLRRDDMERASAAFRESAERLPTFASAWANLGATLGELDRPEEALAAFQHALTAEPDSHQALNNIGVVSRELGRLSESEAALRRVIERVPDLAFGHYNLGHTLFLQGRYQAALTAYAEGQRRDPERNPVQASRLALCRLATGDADGAIRELQQACVGLPKAYRQQILSDASAVAWALLTHKPDLAGWKDVNDWLTRESAD